MVIEKYSIFNTEENKMVVIGHIKIYSGTRSFGVTNEIGRVSYHDIVLPSVWLQKTRDFVEEIIKFRNFRELSFSLVQM